jgi:predicted RNA-binding protein Jag
LEKGKRAFLGLFGPRQVKYRFFLNYPHEKPTRDFLAVLLKKANLELEFSLNCAGEYLLIDLVGSDEELVRRNNFELVESLEHLIKKFLGKACDPQKMYKVKITCAGLANSKEQELEDLARRMREKVLAGKKSVTLNSMSPAERRIIHQFFSKDDKVKTTSVGDGHYKKIEISPQ